MAECTDAGVEESMGYCVVEYRGVGEAEEKECAVLEY